ncbi:GL26129 [Drosophila persimilis]|uniref:GL26129 n=1 Tax=Drosophila persimilis TaxID=7234 RepID=B4GKP5_DROPE|nr:GL26129 [Drosophila persimilis]
MLLPDQTYADYDVGQHHQHLTYRKSRRSRSPQSKQRSKSSSASSSSYDRTADFFENIPDFVGDSLPSFLYSPQGQEPTPERNESKRNEGQRNGSRNEVVAEEENSESTSQSENCEDDDVLKLCEDFLCRHRMRPDFFCQYHKAVSSTTPSPKQRKASPAIVDTTAPSSGMAAAEVKEQKISKEPISSKISAVVERFTKFSAIYTLPVAKRKKSCNKTTGNITDQLLSLPRAVLLSVTICAR